MKLHFRVERLPDFEHFGSKMLWQWEIVSKHKSAYRAMRAGKISFKSDNKKAYIYRYRIVDTDTNEIYNLTEIVSYSMMWLPESLFNKKEHKS